MSTPSAIARLQRVAVADAHEGPVYAADEHALYFTTNRPRASIMRLALATGAVSLVRAQANAANGMAMGREGRLIVCEQGSLTRPAAITRLDRATGAVETLADGWMGLPLSSPNDVVVKRDGTIWFTDPGYGHLQGFRPPPAVPDRVYRLDPATGGLDVVAEDFDKPNGLAFSPDESILYVGDNGAPHELLAFDVAGGRRLARRRVLAAGTPGHPDGLKVDAQGRIYASSAGGVRVLAPDGEPLGEIPLPGAVNFAFAGDDLLITADTAIWRSPLPWNS